MWGPAMWLGPMLVRLRGLWAVPPSSLVQISQGPSQGCDGGLDIVRPSTGQNGFQGLDVGKGGSAQRHSPRRRAAARFQQVPGSSPRGLHGRPGASTGNLDGRRQARRQRPVESRQPIQDLTAQA